MFPGFGTLVNVLTVLVGSVLGVLLGHRLGERTRTVVTDALGLITLLIAASSALAVRDPVLAEAVGSNAPMLIVLGSLILGGVAGSLLRLEQRLEGLGETLQRRLAGGKSSARRKQFVEGFLNASLVFCVGPLTVLGSLSDGLGQGPDQLLLKATMDGFASIAFAAAYGWGVAASALAVLGIQGALTGVGAVAGSFLGEPEVLALTATGGLLLIGVALRLLRIRQLAVGDLLPALIIAPAITTALAAVI